MRDKTLVQIWLFIIVAFMFFQLWIMHKNSNSLDDDGGDLEPKFVKKLDKVEDPGFHVPERFAADAKSKEKLNQDWKRKPNSEYLISDVVGESLTCNDFLLVSLVSFPFLLLLSDPLGSFEPVSPPVVTTSERRSPDERESPSSAHKKKNLRGAGTDDVGPRKFGKKPFCFAGWFSGPYNHN